MKVLLLCCLMGFFLVCAGCASSPIQFNVDSYFNGELFQQGYGGYAGTCYPYGVIRITNGTRYTIVFQVGGKDAVIQPAQTLRHRVSVPCGQNIRVTEIMTGKVFIYDSNDFIGIVERQFSFYGNYNENKIASWPVDVSDIRRATTLRD